MGKKNKPKVASCWSSVTKTNWIGHILRRNCLLEYIIERKIPARIEAKEKRGRRRKKLLDDLWEKRGYCKLTEEALDRTGWGTRF